MNYPLYNSTLCSDLWDKKGDSYTMKPEVRDRLMKIADDFTNEYLKEANITTSVKDVVVIGSIAHYNWNKYSDIDLHLVFDYKDLDMSEEDAFTMLTAVKINWNKSHDIKIKGHDLELGVQGIDQENHSKSSYSVKRNKWITPPTKESVKFDKETIKSKHKMMKEKIDALLKDKDDAGLRRVLEKLYVMRQAGLDRHGEYSAENIVFKILRAQGYLDKIKDHAAKIYDKEMTLHEGLIDDGISSDDGSDINWVSDKEEGEKCLVPTDNEKTKHMKKVYGMKIFGAYRISPKAVATYQHEEEYGNNTGKLVKDKATDLRHAVKKTSEKSKPVLDKLIDDSIEKLFLEPAMDMKSINIIMPLGSRSPLNSAIANKIKSRIPNVIIIDEFLKKDVWKNVRFSPTYYREVAEGERTGQVKLGPLRAKIKLERKQRNHPNEEFHITDLSSGERRYFSFFYKTDTGKHIDVIAKLKNARILFIDDTLEQGATIVDAKREILKYEPKDIVAYIFLFSRGSGI